MLSRASVGGVVRAIVVWVVLCVPGMSRAADVTDVAAKRYARRAIESYKAGNYVEAAQFFEKAYALSKRPTQLRNAAKAYEAADDLDAALSLWTRYRDHSGVDQDDVAEAEAHIKLIHERRQRASAVEEAEAAKARADAASQEAEKARQEAALARQEAEAARGFSVPAVVPYSTLGVGAASLIAGGVLWLVQSQQLSSLDERLAGVDDQGKINQISQSELQPEVDDINRLRITSGVMLGVGIVLAASGVALLPFIEDEEIGTSMAPVVQLGTDRTVIGWETRW